jgi:hypothetical protein
MPAQPQSRGTPWIDEETGALLQLGFFKVSDVVFALAIFLVIFASVVWGIAARPGLLPHVLAGVVVLILLCLWIVTLVYRACFFILRMRAVIETMPERAATLALKLFEMRISQPEAAHKESTLPPL